MQNFLCAGRSEFLIFTVLLMNEKQSEKRKIISELLFYRQFIVIEKRIKFFFYKNLIFSQSISRQSYIN